jgi:hypothetical protein
MRTGFTTVYQMGGMIILHGPVSPNSRTPETKPLPINRRAQNFGRRDDRPGDAGCTHTVSVGPERTNRPSFPQGLDALQRQHQAKREADFERE